MCSPPAQWMSGNGVHIFSIMITFYAIYNPIKSAFTVNTGAVLGTHPPTGCRHRPPSSPCAAFPAPRDPATLSASVPALRGPQDVRGR